MNPYGPQQLANAIRTVRKNTILVAEDIPEESYGYRVTPDSRSVTETLLHIAAAPQISFSIHGSERIFSIEDFQLFGTILKEAPIHERLPYSKAQIVDLLRSEGEKWAEFVERIPQSQADELVAMPNGAPSQSRFEMLQGLKEHEMHHRAQLMVVERLLGVVPHLTRNRRPAPPVATAAAAAH
ncbi:MAG TPA: DinB family protein [Thermoanaerobaculia bacterium]|nr:DinB family protein [Thermoanaerobaculia bacterium]